MNKKDHTDDWKLVCESLRPDDGIPSAVLASRERRRKKSRRTVDHRAEQYCKQVHHAIEGGLACDCGDHLLSELDVASVEPIAGCSALLVTVTTPVVSLDRIDELQRRLTQQVGVLRTAVASETHRKRVPSLRFRVLPRQQGR